MHFTTPRLTKRSAKVICDALSGFGERFRESLLRDALRRAVLRKRPLIDEARALSGPTWLCPVLLLS